MKDQEGRLGDALKDVMDIRRGVAADAEELAAAAERWFRETFSPDNTAEDMAIYCASAFSPVIQRAQLTDPAVETLLLHDALGRLTAYAQLRDGGPDGIAALPAPIELWRFYVDSSQHGRGLAARLMAAVDEAARARGAKTLWLGVWEKNHRARAYYRKAGFIDIGSHDFHLGHDLQTDRLLSRPL
jgi:diamine N-acetyltransferase